MRIRFLVIAAMTAVTFGGAGKAVAAPAIAPVGPFGPLAELVVRRVLLGDFVAAAKYGTGQPIDDPVREQKILDTVTAESVRLGMPPEPSVRFFRAQIEASKVVQRGLFSRWERHPGQRPVRKPDLATEVRPRLDELTMELLRELHATLQLRRPNVVCGIWRVEAETSADIVHRLDKLHRRAVAVSMRPICQS
ncbi:gamma subclass chorismate mutase AroQ [Kibdelosporangium persicum]|uniref:chorismate mutase n=1 Tax=Kibdelosporangium persicum TaxID=2698649 RepID=A0ABX2FCS3_9PSEU|nr:gamma subclass chorismate mutase AroQ [Kibdelosporangium persicum]NRN68954.1 Gamma subclass chorismate mutase AroQ [Kibdelosporangium persicum]